MYYTPSSLLPPLALSSTLLPSLAPSSLLLPSPSTSPSIRRRYRPSVQATIVCQSDQLYHPISQRSKQRKKKLTAPSSMQTARRASIISPTSNTMRVAVYPKRGVGLDDRLTEFPYEVEKPCVCARKDQQHQNRRKVRHTWHPSPLQARMLAPKLQFSPERRWGAPRRMHLL